MISFISSAVNVHTSKLCAYLFVHEWMFSRLWKYIIKHHQWTYTQASCVLIYLSMSVSGMRKYLVYLNTNHTFAVKQLVIKKQNNKHTFLLESYDTIFISFLLLTDLDAVFNGLYWSSYVKLQVQITELIFIGKNHFIYWNSLKPTAATEKF